MTRTDTRFTDPKAATVHDALVAAFRQVSEAGAAARVPHTKISLTRVAKRTVDEPEGVEFWATRNTVATGVAGQVLVAWWTAVSGRRHVRVLGRVVTPETGYLVNASKMSTRPPVWHVFPDRVYRRRAGKANDLITVCGCGAAGTEKALGWAGPCCGPCIDFQEEHGAPPPQRPALLQTPAPCLAVAASADGRWVAAAGTGQVWLWDLDAGAEPVYTSADAAEAVAPSVRPQLALSADGHYLAVTGAVSDGLRVTKPRASPHTIAVQVRGVETVAFRPASVRGPVPSAPTLFDELPEDPDPVRDAMYFVASGHIMVASPPGTHARELAIPLVDRAGPLAFSRDGSRLAVRRDQQIRIYETGGQTLATVPLPRANVSRLAPTVPLLRRTYAPQVAFSPDGGQVAVGNGRALAVHHAVTGESRFHDDVLPDDVTGVAFAPGGRWLYVGRRDGSLIAYRTDIISDERSVVFRWSLGPIHALAACGDALVTACDEGVQVWPMTKLLEGV